MMQNCEKSQGMMMKRTEKSRKERDNQMCSKWSNYYAGNEQIDEWESECLYGHHFEAGKMAVEAFLARSVPQKVVMKFGRTKDGMDEYELVQLKSAPNEFYGTVASVMNGDGTVRSEVLDLDLKQVCLRKEIVEMVLECHEIVEGVNFDMRHFEEAMEEVKEDPMKEMWQTVQINQFVELQSAHAPDRFFRARIINMRCGFLHLEVPSTREEQWVHMFDPMVHAIGWAAAQRRMLDSGRCSQSVRDVKPTWQTKGEKQFAKKNAAPSFIWRENYIPPHGLKENDVLVVANCQNTAFYYAHVVKSSQNGRYFFNLKVGENVVKVPETEFAMAFHIGHPRLFTFEFAFDVALNVTYNVTEEKVERRKANRRDLEEYMERFATDGRVVTGEIGCAISFRRHILDKMNGDEMRLFDDEFDRTATEHKYLEVLRHNRFGAPEIKAAMIVGNVGAALRIQVFGEPNDIVVHMHDPNLLRFGTSKEAGLHLDYGQNREEEPKVTRRRKRQV